MEKKDIDFLKERLDTLVTEKTRSCVIGVFNLDGTLAIHPVGAFIDHIVIGELTIKGATDQLMGTNKPMPKPVSPLIDRIMR